MQSSGLKQIPNKLENIPTNSQSYQASSVICGFPTPDKIKISATEIQITGSISMGTQQIQCNGIDSTGDINLSNNARLIGLIDPQLDSEPVNKGYLDNLLDTDLEVNNLTVNGGILMQNNAKITGLQNPTLASEPVNKGYLDNLLDTNLEANNLTVDGGILMQNNAKITGLQNPTLSSEPVNLGYLNNKLATQLNVNDLYVSGRISNLQTPVSNSEPVTLQYLQTQQQYAQSDVSVGTIQIWFKSTSTIPTNYLLCDGSSFDQSVYPELFVVLGTNILPDLRNEFIRGDSSGSSNIGQHVDQSDVPLAAHSHFYDKSFLSVSFATDRIWAPLDDPRTYVTSMSGSYQSTQTSYDGGSLNPTPFYPAHIVVNFIIKAKSTRAFRNSIQNDSLATASLIANVDRLFANIQLDMNNNKIINLPAPINDSDVATKLYVDQASTGGVLINKLQNGLQQLILQPTELQSTVDLNMQLHKITNLANATSNQDALNLITADNRYYSNLLRLNQLLTPTSSLNLNNQKISNLANATLTTDAVNLGQADAKYQTITTPINQLTLAISSLNLNNQKISNLANGTLSTDAINLGQADAKYQTISTPINQLTLATSSLNLNSQKIINLADASLATDALNRQTGDNRYYLNTTPLQNVTLATDQLNMNAQKISNMATGTLFNDAVILQQLQQWIAMTTTINQTPATATWTLPFQEITQTSTQHLMYNSLTNRVNLIQAGIFDVQILIKGTYTNFNQPISFQINSTGGVIQRSITQQQPTSNGTLTTTYTQFIVNAAAGEFWVEIISNPSVITLNSGCYLLAKKMY